MDVDVKFLTSFFDREGVLFELFFANEALAIRRTAVVVRTATRLVFEAFIVGFLIGKWFDLTGRKLPRDTLSYGRLSKCYTG